MVLKTFHQFSIVKAGLLAISVIALSACESDTRRELPLADHPEIAAVLEATDARNADAPVFQRLIDAGEHEVLNYLGQIGGAVACKRLETYVGHAESTVRRSAARASSLCLEEAPVVALLGK